MLDLKAIKKRVDATTDGGWTFKEMKEQDLYFVEMDLRPYGDYLREVFSDEDYPTKRNDFIFMANAKRDIYDLLQHIEKLTS